ncbi:GNAT family N-acetyltransferase [Rhodobacteraceae bacterium CCMM004]|nr:GNAT family N-acetyltransferase [Rhodobacteraceae bacterium CCMM004]
MDDIDRIRRFNRTYTTRLGLLDRGFLGSDLPIGALRILFDLDVGETTARTMARALGLDEGYVSRLLARLERAGWVERRRDPSDRRIRRVALTPAGAAARTDLVARARGAVAEMTAPLGAPGTAALADAMDRVTALLTPPDPAAVTLRPLASGDAGWLIERHAVLYSRDEGFDTSFEVLVARILADFLEDHDPACEAGWIADAGGRRMGSIFCVESGVPGTAKLRLFQLEPEARGLGLGRRMLTHCMGFARDAGYTRMTLWTHESHRAACALYAATGFALTDSRPVRSFGRDLVEQEWQIAL